MRPLNIAVDDAVLDDLRRRLELARWPAELPDSNRYTRACQGHGRSS
jgi:hypothetical protein